MAKRKFSNDNVSADRGKVRVLYVEMEGNNESLQQSISALAQAMSQPVYVPASRRVPNQLSANEDARQDEGDTQGSFDQLYDNDDENGNETTVEEESSEPRVRRGEGPKRDRNTGISLNPNLNLKPEGKEPLENFFARKSPDTQQGEIAVFVFYLKEIAEMQTCTINDVFTCFKKTGRKLPKDLRQSIRNTEKTQGWVTGSLQDLAISTAGQNYVEHDLPGMSGE